MSKRLKTWSLVLGRRQRGEMVTGGIGGRWRLGGSWAGLYLAFGDEVSLGAGDAGREIWTFAIVDGLCLRTGLVVSVADADSCSVGGRDVAPLSGWGLGVGQARPFSGKYMDRTIYIGGAV